jgi:enediyne biosynthesis protein E4
MGRYDASFGTLLLGDGKGGFKVVPNKDSGISIKGEVRKLEPIKVAGKNHYLAFRNNEMIMSITLKE